MDMRDLPPSPSGRPAWHALAVDEVAGRLGTDLARGLSRDGAAARRAAGGPNEIERGEGRGAGRILGAQLAEPLVVVLLAATAASAALWGLEGPERGSAPWDAILILAIVVVNAALGFVQEFRAERALEALEAMAAPEARARRDGRTVRIPARDLVPGDLVRLRAGDRVPADLRLTASESLRLDEAALTGESVPVETTVEPVAPGAPLPDRPNMAYLGTTVPYGRGEGVVVATGMATEMGSIAALLAGVGEEPTPLQRELGRVARQLGVLVVGISIVVAGAGLVASGRFGVDVVLDMFLFGVALAVAAVPEGLPAIVTAVLAIGVRRLAERDAIVRRLPAVEALGSATVIASDKTGTITRNEMTVRRILLGADRSLVVEGEGYAPEGTFREGSGAPVDPAAEPRLARLLEIAALTNDAELVREDGRWAVEGDPTEGALLAAAGKAGLDRAALEAERPRHAEVPFDGGRQRMTTVHPGDGGLEALVKGAPEVLLDRAVRVRTDRGVADLDPAGRARIRTTIEAWADDALRSLAFASRALESAEPVDASVERDLVWEGMAGLIDPPRKGVAASVERARRAGIRTLLVTGDHARTGRAIAVEVGIAAPDAPVLAGAELAALDDRALAGRVREVSVYGRVRPEDKLRIVRTLQADGEIVAVTGDGVNDAPALKEAHIGVAMGRSGTDVSREAAEIVLADDDYSTIVDAIAEGRRIFESIRTFVRYLLTSNAGEVGTLFVGVAAAGPLGLAAGPDGILLPLLAVQVLWINLVTDGPPALALGMGPPDPGAMERPPRDPGAPIVDGSTWIEIGLVGVVMTTGTLFVLDACLPGGFTDWLVGAGDPERVVRRARTAAFTTLVLFQMANAFVCAGGRRSVLSGDAFRNRWLLAAVAGSLALQVAAVHWGPLQRGISAAPLSASDWLVAAGVASTVVVASEALAAVRRRR